MIKAFGESCLALLLVAGFGAGEFLVAAEPARAATITDRVQHLEKKTDYFKKTNRRIVKQYVRRTGASQSAAQPGECLPQGVQFRIDPVVTLGGSAYTWITTTINYSGIPLGDATSQPLFATFWKPDNATYPCARTVPISEPAGALTVKQFCSFDVGSGDKFTMQVVVQGFSGDGSHCVENYVQSITTTAKFTLIGIVEPP